MHASAQQAAPPRSGRISPEGSARKGGSLGIGGEHHGGLAEGVDHRIRCLCPDAQSAPSSQGLALIGRLSWLDRLLPVWILLTLTLGLTWGLGPLLMFSLAWLFLPDQPAFRTGLILIGIAPCIAMVLIWIDLAQGNREAAALLVAINSILPAWLGLDSQIVRFSFGEIARAVLIFLGIPLLAGFLTRVIGVRLKGGRWYEQVFLPRIGPWALYGLLFTIVVMFALQGQAITSDPAQVIPVAIPLLLYFVLMWSLAFAVGKRSGLDYPRTSALAFTAAGNNCELAIALCISIWGVRLAMAAAEAVADPLIGTVSICSDRHSVPMAGVGVATAPGLPASCLYSCPRQQPAAETGIEGR